MMKRITFLAGTLFALTVIFGGVAAAQEPDPPSRFELGAQFSSLTYSRPTPSFGAISGNGRTEAGFGGRFTFNLNRHVALEAESNFFPHENFDDTSSSGRLWQGQFGVKAGKRYGKFGVFGKARPGFASFSQVYTVVGTTTIDFNGTPIAVPVFDTRRKTYFSMDLGGVLEFYPSRKVLTRIDVGDTLIHYGDGSEFPGSARGTRHNLQVSAGIALRFGALAPEETSTAASQEKIQRFEVGAQFSSFSFTAHEHFSASPTSIPPAEFSDTLTQPGFGGRFTFNLTPSFALEAQGDFFPGKSRFFNNARAGGRTLQLQAGIKAGKRFEKFGVFGKARPGVVSFSETVFVDGVDVLSSPIFRIGRRTHPSFDLGGVLEFYPSRRIVTRFDAGDTMIRYGSISIPFVISPTSAPAETIHSFEFSAGVGFRF
jgi:outer membrane protein with beta-barrel domain